ncbi:MAG: ferredoxin [Boseongicola sp.]
MTIDQIADRVCQDYLEVFGAFHTRHDDGIGIGTLVLLGPHEPGFWTHVLECTEFQDREADPLDRWSTRVITKSAKDLGGEPHFPFGAPPKPFQNWAIRSGRAWVSPVILLVHDIAGLMVSYRGAILVPELLELPATATRPCEACDDKPCQKSCPVSALTANGYDLNSCHSFLDTDEGATCMQGGCAVRRSCPAGAKYRRIDVQSAYHMERFHPCH